MIAAHPTLPARLLGRRKTVAVRVPDHAVARGLAAELGHPVTATSANRSGAPAPTTATEAIEELGPELALVLDGGATGGAAPSTIVDARNGVPVLLRVGKVPWARVLQSLT